MATTAENNFLGFILSLSNSLYLSGLNINSWYWGFFCSTYPAQELERSSRSLILCSFLREASAHTDNLSLNCVDFDWVSLDEV
jgi:hypothetical protein